MDLLIEGIQKGIAKKTENTKKIVIGGQSKDFPVYRIKIDYLFFNDRNDRIATFIDKYKHEKQIKEFDRTNLAEYNNVLHDFIVESNKAKFDNTKKNIEMFGQIQDAVVLRDGRIIDGNRRFTCLRELAKKNGEKFEYLNAIILEQSIENDEREIKMLELNLQQGEDAKVPYDPIDRLVGIYNDIEKKKNSNNSRLC